MAGAIWCVVEDDRQGNPKKVMAEVLGEASRLASPLAGQAEAVWLTDKATEAGIKQLGEWGAKRVLLVENAGLAPYRGEVWAPVLAELVQKESPQAVFGAVTTRQREVMARLAARLGAGLAADVVALAVEDGKLVATRPVYAGKLLSKMTWAKTPWLATLRPNVFKPAEAQSGAAAAGSRDRRTSSSWNPSPRCWGRRWVLRAQPSMRAGGPTASRSGRRGGPSRRSCIWGSASRAPSSTWRVCAPPR